MRKATLWLLVAMAACTGEGDKDTGTETDADTDTDTDSDTDADTDADTDTDTDTDVDADCSDFDMADPPEVTPNDECLAEVEPGTLDPVVEWQWDTNTAVSGAVEVISTPMVARIVDTDGDSDVDEDDLPSIAVLASSTIGSTATSTVTLLKGDGTQLWSVSDVEGEGFMSQGAIAVGDLDGDGSVDLCTSGSKHAVVCLESDGSLKWAAGDTLWRRGAPAIADMDGDGVAEVVLGNQIYAGDDGEVLSTADFESNFDPQPAVVDWDGDGQLEAIDQGVVWELDGTIVWEWEGSPLSAVAVGDLDADGEPEAVFTVSGGLVALDNDGTEMWKTESEGALGGPPTIADFDADGEPEVGSAGLTHYTVLEGDDGSIVWFTAIKENGSAAGTASSVFDFEGDGEYEVVFADENTVWFFDGSDGSERGKITGHASGTAGEYPSIADVDGDGSAEVIVGSNTYYTSAAWKGVTVIGSDSDSWQPARPIWNQFGYHITNIEDDGSVPRTPAKNWLSWNSYRAADDADAPAAWLADARALTSAICTFDCDEGVVRVFVGVGNEGLAPTGLITVELVSDEAESAIATGQVELASGESTWVGNWEISEALWGASTVTAHVDVGGDADECDETDNTLDLGAWPCE